MFTIRVLVDTLTRGGIAPHSAVTNAWELLIAYGENPKDMKQQLNDSEKEILRQSGRVKNDSISVKKSVRATANAS